jgi:hypothetical protein
MTARTQGIFHEIKASLIQHDAVFAALEAEKRLGWESEDVDRLWKKRDEKLSMPDDQSTISDTKRSFRAPVTSSNRFSVMAEDSADDDMSESAGQRSATRSFRKAKGPSYDKYYDFYRNSFKNSQEVFIPVRRRFVDIGCAPGGLCAYMIRDLGWSGYGFTLPYERGGLLVRFRDDDNLRLSYCDMSEAGSVDQIESELSAGGDESGRFDFINCGVVLGKHQLNSLEDAESGLSILRVNRNQFLVTLRRLGHGGSILWVFQSASIGAWFYFLNKLNKIFGKIELFSTLVPSRSPVYALCSGFKLDSPAVSEWLAELEAADPITPDHLLDWNISEWKDAVDVMESLREDLHAIWTTQREGLREIREAAASVGREDDLLKKLSGHRSPVLTGCSSRKSSGSGRADFSLDWRSSVSSKAPRKTNTHNCDIEDNWRR